MDLSKLDQEIATFISKTPKSKELQERARSFMPGGSSRGTAYYDPYPAFIDRGLGNHVFDVDGNRYIDYMINATSLIMGHAHPLIVDAINRQAAKGTAYSGPSELQIVMAEMLCKRIPSMDSVRFANSGTEATLNTIRVARAFTGKHKIAKFEGGYHGSHEYVSVSVRPPLWKLDPSGPTSIPEFPGQPPSVGREVIVMPYNDLEKSEELLRRHKSEISCVIMEPVASAIGYLPGNIEFLKGIRELTSELGIILIYDEVQSFRIGPGGAQVEWGIKPDLTALGKTIGGGFPVGAFGGRMDLMDMFDPTQGGATIPHAGTFNANPMTLAAGKVVLEQLTPKCYDRLNSMGNDLRMRIQTVFDELDVSACVTGVGSLFGIHFTNEKIVDYRSMLRGDQDMRKALFMGLVNEGVLLQIVSAGALSTVTTDQDNEVIVNAVRSVVERIK